MIPNEDLPDEDFPNEPNIGAEPVEPEELMSRPELNPNVDWNEVEANVAARNGAHQPPASPNHPPQGLPEAPRKAS